MRETLHICNECDITFMAYDNSCPMCKLEYRIAELETEVINATVEGEENVTNARVEIAELKEVVAKCVCKTLAGE